MKAKYYSFLSVLMLTLGISLKAQLTTVLSPVQDAYFLSFGGGQGGNPILKFNISSIPAGATIVKATLEVYVWDTINPTGGFGSPVCGNMLFRNLNNKQAWVEADSAYLHASNNQVYTDSVIALTGFGDSIGWASSPNLKSIVIRDHNVSNTYCTISLKDPDDLTCCGATGPNFSQMLGDLTDSLITGNSTVGSDGMIFYPREYANPNLRPKLTVEYICSVSNTQNLTICAGQTVMVGSSVYNASGNYVDTLTAQNGCDSIVTTSLTVNVALDLTVTVQGGNVLSSLENGATYQWIDCNAGNAAINGATSQTYTTPPNGDFAVIVTKNNCSDTSACVNVSTSRVAKHGLAARTYPNPVTDILTVELDKGHYEISLCDISGRVIFGGTVIHKAQIDLKNESKGLYLLKIKGDNETKVIKIVKD